MFTTSGRINALAGGLKSWNNSGIRAYIQDEPDFTAASVVDRTDGNKIYSVITGTAAASVPTSGTANYSGRYALIRLTAAHGGTPWGYQEAQTSNVDFGAGTIVGSGGPNGFAYNATISGTSRSGTMQFNGDGAVTAPLEGGFYGTNTLVGAFTSPTIVGHFYGKIP